jgi:NAD-dependent dihydropyrimidine dehydrogenase PreA subunit
VPHLIAGPCIDVLDMSCVDECPVDCIYEGQRKNYIQPDECIDCGACVPVCPVDAIYEDRNVPPEEVEHQQDNRRFFLEPLPGRDAALGSPGGSHQTGRIGADTDLVASMPERA